MTPGKNPIPPQVSDDELTLEVSALRMLQGATIASVCFFGPIVAIYLLYLVGTLLPAESRERPDPTPDSFSYLENESDG